MATELTDMIRSQAAALNTQFRSGYHQGYQQGFQDGIAEAERLVKAALDNPMQAIAVALRNVAP